MEKHDLVYRYREFKSHNIRCLLMNSINGSLFFNFSKEDQGEMNYALSDSFLKKHNFTLEDINGFVEAIKNNTKYKYYLSCFTLNEPKSSSEEWNKYASNGKGYCLVYRLIDIEKAVQYSVRSEKRTLIFDRVNYSNEPYYLDLVTEELIKVTNKDQNLESDKQNIIDLLPNKREIGIRVSQAFFHKKANFSSYNEMRIVEFVDITNEIPNSKFKDCLVHVKPIEIIIPKTYVPYDISTILEFAKESIIPIRYI